MAYKDLREWIDRLDQEGLLKRITVEVDWNEEIGAVTRKVLKEQGPALLFENIKDYKDTLCTRFFTNGLGSRERVALALGLGREASYSKITTTLKEGFQKPMNYVMVNTGPVKENIIKGGSIDLYQFPAPLWHHLDGGRYINTMCSVVTKDPDTGELNIGTYRGMIAGKDSISVLLALTQHWGYHFAKYREKGMPMPVAVIYGWDPALILASSLPVQHKGYSEFEICSSLRGKPAELVRCETNDLVVPAWAEIVVEGTISPDPSHYKMEGPFGEYPGYYGGMASPKPTIKLECITHRNNPILRGSLVGFSPGKWSEDGCYSSGGWSAAAWAVLETAGVPNVLDVWGHPVTLATNMRVKIKKIYRGHAKQVANAIWGSGVANYAAKHLIVVDEDIDIHDDEAVEWALAYRVNADMDDIIFFPGTFGSMLDPSTPLPQRDVAKYGQGKWTRVLIDATKNWELEKQEQYGGDIYPSLATEIDPKQQELIERRWKEYGF